MNTRLFARLTLAVGLVTLAVLVRPGTEKAEAQGVSITVEFREALAPHGRWQRHARYGEVWIPARVDREWRPYTRGQWVYTDDWGWYWVSAREEEQWGWVAYHYGRWVFDREVGWIWIPGNEWAPAWVSWRRGGGEEIGWAPLPPDDYIDELDDNPDVWIFVRSRDVIAPSIVRVLLPRPRVIVLVRETVIVNRTVYVSGARVAANAGVPPSYIAARIGRPIRVSRVQPVVIRGTARVEGAIEVNPREQRGRQFRTTEVKQAERSIQPAKDVPEPKRFERNRAPDTPDAPKVLRQAQPQAPDSQQKQAPDAQPKKDDTPPQTQPQKQDAPKAKQEKDDAAPKREETPKTRQEKRDDVTPKAKQEKNDTAPKAKRDDGDGMRQKRDDSTPKIKQENRDQAPKAKQEKRGEDTAPKQTPKRDDTSRGDQQPKREVAPKQDGAPKAQQQQQAPKRPDPAAKGPGPKEKDN